MLSKFKMLSVNQINAQIKLNEMWKSVNIANYPVVTNVVARVEDVAQTRAVSSGQLMEVLLANISEKSFVHDATHIWNKVPLSIKHCLTYSSAKKAI